MNILYIKNNNHVLLNDDTKEIIDFNDGSIYLGWPSAIVLKAGDSLSTPNGMKSYDQDVVVFKTNIFDKENPYVVIKDLDFVSLINNKITEKREKYEAAKASYEDDKAEEASCEAKVYNYDKIDDNRA